MASELRVDKIIPSSGTSIGIGTASGTINILGNSQINTTGVITATSFVASGTITGEHHGNGANLTNIPAANLTGTIADARISTLTASKLSGALPALDGSALTGVGVGTADSINTSGIITATAFIPTVGQLSHRNKVINGGMIVHQRGDASATGSAAYLSCDRFKTNNGCGAQVAVTKSTDTPDGFGASTKWDCTTADTSVAASDFFLIQHRLEGQNIQDFAKGTSSAKQFALSFYIKATKTGVYTVELEDVDNNRHCSKTITVSDTNWNRYKIIYPADTTGAFVNDNNFSLSINFWLMGGSNYTSGTLQSSSWGTGATTRCSSSNVNAMDSTSNDFYLTGVQLEVGETVTPFEHRSYGDELLRCQRYFISGKAAIGSAYNGWGGSQVQGVYLTFPVIMRSDPTITFPTNHSSSNVVNADYTYHVSSTGFSYRVNLSGNGNYHRQSTYHASSEL